MQILVLNADDFGASYATNGAIVRAHREGVLTSASLMVTEPAAQEAVRFAQESPDLGVGLHLALSDGLPATDAPALVGPDGRFPANPALAGIRGFFRADARRQIRLEVAAQFERFAATGLPWSHVDGHQHLHLHPVIWDALIQQCGHYPVRWVRIPYEEFRPASREKVAGRRMEWLFFRALRRRCLRSLHRAGLRAADRVYGHLETGRMTDEYLITLLPRMRGEVNEVYLHPGTAHAAQLAGAATPMDVELHALLSPRVKALLKQSGLLTTNFENLLVVLGEATVDRQKQIPTG